MQSNTSSSLTIPLRKMSKTQKQLKIQRQRQKFLEMIDIFYEKTRIRIEKSISKQNKKSTILCKELLDQLSLHPKQQLYNISRLSDQMFQIISKLNNIVGEFIKQFDAVRNKIGKELGIQKQKTAVKENNKCGQYDLAVLRRINFRKEKTSLNAKLSDIDTINKKIVKFEVNDSEESNVIEIDGRRAEANVHKYKKIWFQTKKKEYLLCLTYNKNSAFGKLTLFSDKLQVITTFSHLPPINIMTFRDVVQVDHYLYLVHSHEVIKIDLLNQSCYEGLVLRERINRAEENDGNLVLWVEDQHFNHFVLILTPDLQIIFQMYLRINISSIGLHFKVNNQDGGVDLYFIGRVSNGHSDLFKIEQKQIVEICKDIGGVDEIVSCRAKGKVQSILMRKGSQLYRFIPPNTTQKMIQIDIDNGQSMHKCCILGQHFLALHQSGKYLIDCLLKLPQEHLENPQPQL